MNVLIPSRAASEACHKVLPLTISGTMVWAGIENNYPIEKVLTGLHIFSKKPDQELIEKIDQFCEKLREQGFVVLREDCPCEEDQP
jgi:hypothetical protein